MSKGSDELEIKLSFCFQVHLTPFFYLLIEKLSENRVGCWLKSADWEWFILFVKTEANICLKKESHFFCLLV